MSAASAAGIQRVPVREPTRTPRPEQDTELLLLSEPSTLNRFFVLSAIGIFLAIISQSVPNLISAHHPKVDPSRTAIATTVASSGESLSQGPGIQQDAALKSAGWALSRLDSLVPSEEKSVLAMASVHDGEVDHKSRSDRNTRTQVAKLHEMADSGKQSAQNQNNNNQPDEPSPAQPTRAHSFITATPHSPKPEQRQEQPQKTSLIQSVHIWAMSRTAVWMGYRMGMWSVRKTYQGARFVVAKPIEVVAAMAETPYVVTRDVCKAFLPVYSFFAVAAMIGIVLGGTALWIAHLLISAIGADEDRCSQSIVQIQSRSMPRLKSSNLRRATAGRGTDPLVESSSTDSSYSRTFKKSADVAYGRQDAMRRRSKPGLSASQMSGRVQTRDLLIEREDDEDENGEDADDDDDDDDDWNHA
ncbi:hypothetical protein BC939DRAFT_505087 [Gamsiella multidivaricata]|uniref:uncharacterized protein n=1 Tax=Gamsiella multidivaricata TaxID=101098 RepID=UPI002221121E|nr:uncharacterized protein BC939DRAFT_505087 [Gamsiella multidivaricata]KAI7820244.1 hypothetical protein BC939DRAFT_505087 [Gamsiella multidivaricata]